MQATHIENTSERAYRELRDAIIEGRLSTNRKVTETGLAKDLGISRTPVREAIKRLLLEGLLERRKGQGLWCAIPDAGEIREILDLRLRIESYAAARAAECATPAQIAALRKSARHMQALTMAEPVNDDLITQIDQENACFHRLIIEATHSKRLMCLVQLTIDVTLVSRTFRRYSPAQRRRSAGHHLEIAQAIAARSSQWAERMMQVHILSASETYDQVEVMEH